jgi:serine/threonine protein kinase
MPKPFQVGDSVSHYRITGKLGIGGMGVVYEAEDGRLARKVALKFLPEALADDPDADRRLQREADTIAQLNHPNICTIYEIDRHEGRAFIAMECVDGLNLKAYMARDRLSTDEVVEIALQVAAALGAAHAKSIVHRDIKPGNIMVSQDLHVKVLDFGLARRFKVTETHELDLGNEGSTIPGRPMGTANYMAPERILQLPLDPRSDLFSLGVVMFEMATGRLPFAGVSPPETVANVLDRDPVPIAKLAPQHPKSLDVVVRRLLAKRPGSRYPSATELTGALLNVASPNSRLLARLRRRFLGS